MVSAAIHHLTRTIHSLAAMGSSMLVSRKLHHHHLIRHACAYANACRRNLLTTSLNLNEIERESEREREYHYLVQLKCKRTWSTYFTLLSSKNWAPVRTFVAPHFGRCNDFTSACHGVLHFAGNSSVAQGKDLLWMPSTNQFKILAPSKVPRVLRDKHATIDFRPIGFGFDSKTQDYKVVRYVFHWYEEDERDYIGDEQIELYSLKTDSWKEIMELPILESSLCCTRILVNGRCYWRAIPFRRVKSNIAFFDFTTEEFSWLAPPPQTTLWLYCKLVEVDGKLGIMIYNLNDWPAKWGLELFVLGDDGISWTRVFEIYDLVGVRRPVLYDSDAHLLFIEGDDYKDLWVYDIHTGELKKIGLSDEFVHVSPHVVGPVSASAPWTVHASATKMEKDEKIEMLLEKVTSDSMFYVRKERAAIGNERFHSAGLSRAVRNQRR